FTMTTTESKEEISDTDSGIILHSGSGSPTSSLKDLSSHTRALKLKHQSLEERLELCLLELRQLCIREAELTGKMPSDYPLMPDENPPPVRRRIGASFKLDKRLILQDKEDSELQTLETDLAVHQQIYEAARKLSLEEHLSKPQKKSRLQQCKREEKKVRQLQEALFQHRNKSQCSSPSVSVPGKQISDPSMSDDSSLSDVVALDDDVVSSSPPSLPVSETSLSDPLQLSDSLHSPQPSVKQLSGESERSPIQNSPWKESSLDKPYQKLSKPQSASSRSCSPAGTSAPAESCRIPLSQFVRNSALRHSNALSVPSTPELHVRRQYTQSFRLPKNKSSADKDQRSSEGNRGRGRLPQRRCVASFTLRSPDYSPLRPSLSSSEDSSSEISSPCRDGPTEIPKLCPPPYGFHFGAQKKGLSGPPDTRATPEDGALCPPGPDVETPCLMPPPLAHMPPQWRERALSPRRILKPPPPYTRLVRTPSLREYPNHAFRLLPREMVSEELKSWHQRIQLQKTQAGATDGQSSTGTKSPASPHLPSFQQGSGNVVLQRDPDGTPVQWFVAEDAEIVSQV
uniref:Innate immunity activator a n=1 Tax=Tetraodon nigroviridis TaxID=99883 RepID=H3DCC6_TETNG